MGNLHLALSLIEAIQNPLRGAKEEPRPRPIIATTPTTREMDPTAEAPVRMDEAHHTPKMQVNCVASYGSMFSRALVIALCPHMSSAYIAPIVLSMMTFFLIPIYFTCRPCNKCALTHSSLLRIPVPYRSMSSNTAP